MSPIYRIFLDISIIISCFVIESSPFSLNNTWNVIFFGLKIVEIVFRKKHIHESVSSILAVIPHELLIFYFESISMLIRTHTKLTFDSEPFLLALVCSIILSLLPSQKNIVLHWSLSLSQRNVNTTRFSRGIRGSRAILQRGWIPTHPPRYCGICVAISSKLWKVHGTRRRISETISVEASIGAEVSLGPCSSFDWSRDPPFRWGLPQ